MANIEKAEALPQKVIFQNILVYVLPVLLFIVQALITGTIPTEMWGSYFFSPIFILYVVLSVVTPVVIIAICGSFIKKHISSPNAVEIVNKISVFFLRITIVAPAVLNFTLPVLAYDHHNETLFHALACIMQLFGSVGLGGLLGYVFFQPSFEKFLSFVPFEKQWMAMPIRINMFLLGLLTILGSIAMCLGPVILASEVAENVNLTTYILTRVLPVALLATVLGSFAVRNSGRVCPGHSRRPDDAKPVPHWNTVPLASRSIGEKKEKMFTWIKTRWRFQPHAIRDSPFMVS